MTQQNDIFRVIQHQRKAMEFILDSLRGTLQDDTKVDYREVEKLEAKDGNKAK